MTPANGTEIHWLCGREGGLGLVALADGILLLVGDEELQPDQAQSLLLGSQAVDSLFGLLDHWRSSRALPAPVGTPTVAWGDGPPPRLERRKNSS